MQSIRMSYSGWYGTPCPSCCKSDIRSVSSPEIDAVALISLALFTVQESHGENSAVDKLRSHGIALRRILLCSPESVMRQRQVTLVLAMRKTTFWVLRGNPRASGRSVQKLIRLRA